MAQETFEEFRRRVLKLNGPRKHKVTRSFGVYDSFKHYRKNKPKDKKFVLSESQYFSIIRKINELLGEELLQGNPVKFPNKMGKLEIRKKLVSPRLNENGKVIYPVPLDFDRMLRLWYEDDKAFENKTIIKHETKELFRIYYNKTGAGYKNKSFYQFTLNKELKRKISKQIKGGRLDTSFLLQRRDNIWRKNL